MSADGFGDARLGKLMVAFYATQGHPFNFIGECVGIADHPTVHFAAEPGDECQASWAAHLCRPATDAEQIAYWKKRAQKAEELKRSTRAPDVAP